ncbi:MAG: hydroxymethylbilane synthase [Verrucomicrobia bacterium]|nr:hydroxymethylbilane synthase [Verrucomicrobiota bacterium]
MVAARLREVLKADVELLKIVTTGDRQAEWSLEEKGGKGLFTGELEQAVLRGEAAIAVHSTKDLPGEMPPGLVIAGYLPRADASDVLVLRAGLAHPQTLATGSPRRRLQVGRLFPSVEFAEIRGNVDTRLRKIAESGVADGTVLAAAGLQRLGIAGWPGLTFRALRFDEMVPAVGQGAIAVQCRAADAVSLATAFDAATARSLGLERALQSALGGGCHTAFGAHVHGLTLHFFHEQTGLRQLNLAADDLDAPDRTAARLLKTFGLR